jgi:hypothetical protein
MDSFKVNDLEIRYQVVDDMLYVAQADLEKVVKDIWFREDRHRIRAKATDRQGRLRDYWFLPVGDELTRALYECEPKQRPKALAFARGLHGVIEALSRQGCNLKLLHQKILSKAEKEQRNEAFKNFMVSVLTKR